MRNYDKPNMEIIYLYLKNSVHTTEDIGADDNWEFEDNISSSGDPEFA